MTLTLPEDLFTGLAGGQSRQFVAFSSSKDLDDAFDDVARSSTGLDPAHVRAWLDYASAADVAAQQDVPMVFDLALGAALGFLRSSETAVTTWAWPVAAPAGYARTRTPLVVEHIGSVLPSAPAVLLAGDPDCKDAFELLSASAPSVTGAVPARIEIRSTRRRFKPAVEVNRGANSSGYALMTGDRVLASGLPTATAARRLAVDLVKGMDPEDTDLPQVDVVKLAMRESGPFIRVERSLVSQKVRAVMFSYSEKNPDKGPKLAGWLFAGRV